MSIKEGILSKTLAKKMARHAKLRSVHWRISERRRRKNGNHEQVDR